MGVLDRNPENGAAASPLAVNSDSILPVQDGNAGKFLQTDGTTTSWQTAGGGGGANTDLSNLTPTAINQSLVPDTDDNYTVGTTGAQFSEAWVKSVTSDAGFSADINQGQLLGAGGNASVDWANRILKDGAAATVYNWLTNTMSKALAMGSNKITGVADPTSAQDVATKAYVDALASSDVLTQTVTAGQSFAANTTFAVRWNIRDNGGAENTAPFPKVFKADGDNNDEMVIGFVQSASAVVSGDPITLYKFGPIPLGASDTPFTTSQVGRTIYATTTGAFSTTKPTSYKVPIGIVQDVNTIFAIPTITIQPDGLIDAQFYLRNNFALRGLNSASSAYDILKLNSSDAIEISPGAANVVVGPVSSPGVKFQVYVAANNSNVMRVTNASSGASAYSAIQMENNTNSGNAGILVQSSNNTSFGAANSLLIYQGINAPISFVTNSTTRMILEAAGNLSLQNNKIINLADPTSSQDAATKTYVDTASSKSLTVSTITADPTPGQTDVGKHYNCNTSGAAFSISLPDPTVVGSGWHIFVKDKTGDFTTNNLTLARFGSEKIENTAANKILSAAFGFWKIYTDGTDWFIGS